jgi:predicted ATPase
LNFIAGRRAKASTAYASALKYLAAGRALLTEETWDHNYELIFAIEYLMAECELLTANMVGSENRLSMLAQRAKRGHDIAVVTRLRLTLYTTLLAMVSWSTVSPSCPRDRKLSPRYCMPLACPPRI